jgi:RHS repeat-associated protein
LGEYTATATKEYIYLGDTPIAVVQAGNILTIQTDHLDTPRQLTDNTKKVVWNWAYSAFGENQPTNINNTVFNLRYPGQYYDAESKLHYNINRYYDPATGRYIQSDPIGLSGGINTYTYVGGNSIRWSDRTGLEFDFDKFANQIENNRANNALTLGSLVTTLGVGTMPKTPKELRGLGVPKNALNPYTSQLSRWSMRVGNRTLRVAGRTALGVAAGTLATGGLIVEGGYNWIVIIKAACDAYSY